MISKSKFESSSKECKQFWKFRKLGKLVQCDKFGYIGYNETA